MRDLFLIKYNIYQNILTLYLIFLISPTIIANPKLNQKTQDISHLKNYIESYREPSNEEKAHIYLPITVFKYIKNKKLDKNGDIFFEYSPKLFTKSKILVPLYEISSHQIGPLKIDFNPQRYKNYKQHFYAITVSKSFGHQYFIEEKLSSFRLGGVLKKHKKTYSYQASTFQKIFDYNKSPVFALSIGNRKNNKNIQYEVIREKQSAKYKRSKKKTLPSAIGLKLDDFND